MILDADLTVRPEDLPKFYDAAVAGTREFVNGSRLVYGIEPGAMRFLNLLGNKVVLAGSSGDHRPAGEGHALRDEGAAPHDYEEIAAGRAYFGDFDPFGDFDLLFGAARLNLKIVDLPVRYQPRTYGDDEHQPLAARLAAVAHDRVRVLEVPGRAYRAR